MNGFIAILKPPGMTSHDVVNVVRKIMGTKKVGHAGTLDPEAAGVLVVAVGKATRLLEYLQLSNKSYRAEVTFGIATNTQDQEGEVISKQSAGNITSEDINAVLNNFCGKGQQTPPAFSAIKYKGRPLYSLARKGEKIKVEPREIEIYEIKLIKYYQNDIFPKAMIDLSCSKGTYVRTICHDLGENLGCGAHLSALLRTSVGSFKLENSFTLEEINALKDEKNTIFLLPLTEGLADYPEITITNDVKKRVLNGVPIAGEAISPEKGYVRVQDQDGCLLAVGEVVYENETKTIKMRKVIK